MMLEIFNKNVFEIMISKKFGIYLQDLRPWPCVLSSLDNSWNIYFLLKYVLWELHLESGNIDDESLN